MEIKQELQAKEEQQQQRPLIYSLIGRGLQADPSAASP